MGKGIEIFKFILLGDAETGKSSIRTQLTENKFSSNYRKTIGGEFGLRTHKTENDLEYKIQLWDTAGDEKYKLLRQIYIKDSKVVFIVFDVTKEQALQNIPKYIEEIEQANQEDKPRFILVGNKIDLVDQRKVAKEEIDKFIREDLPPQEYEYDYFEVSAKEGTNIETLFSNTLAKVIEQEQKLHAGTVQDVKLEQTPAINENNNSTIFNKIFYGAIAAFIIAGLTIGILAALSIIPFSVPVMAASFSVAGLAIAGGIAKTIHNYCKNPEPYIDGSELLSREDIPGEQSSPETPDIPNQANNRPVTPGL